MAANNEDFFKNLVSHCKEYGFVFPSSEIYDGLSAVYDYGQYGSELKNNIRAYWWNSMTRLHENIVGIDAAIFMHPTTWKASGHVDAFNDPLIDNKDSKKRYRADVLIEDHVAKIEGKINKEVSKARDRFGDLLVRALSGRGRFAADRGQDQPGVECRLSRRRANGADRLARRVAEWPRRLGACAGRGRCVCADLVVAHAREHLAQPASQFGKIQMAVRVDEH